MDQMLDSMQKLHAKVNNVATRLLFVEKKMREMKKEMNLLRRGKEEWEEEEEEEDEEDEEEKSEEEGRKKRKLSKRLRRRKRGLIEKKMKMTKRTHLRLNAIILPLIFKQPGINTC